jgi:hypothetical protein
MIAAGRIRVEHKFPDSTRATIGSVLPIVGREVLPLTMTSSSALSLLREETRKGFAYFMYLDQLIG